MQQKKSIYLDHGASTPVAPEVVAAMAPYWSTIYANSGSSHQFGQAASAALENARRRIADLWHVQPKEIVFTGGGSESDNLALRGVMWAARRDGRGNHMITSTIEHPAVKATAVQLRDLFGFDVTFLPVDGSGRVQPAAVAAAMRADTVLISVMAANNEIGTLQPVREIAQIARAHSALFHTDAIQSAATTPWDLSSEPIDLMSIAPHKFYGPKGIGILYLREGIDLVAAVTGGPQENGRRAGTVNVPLAVGAATALQLAYETMSTSIAHYEALRDRLIAGVLASFGDNCRLTGHPTDRLPHHASFAFHGINANNLLMHLDIAGIAASSGSACKTGNPKPAAVLQALGLDDTWSSGGLRLTVGKQNSLSDIDYTLETLRTVVPKLFRLQTLAEHA